MKYPMIATKMKLLNEYDAVVSDTDAVEATLDVLITFCHQL